LAAEWASQTNRFVEKYTAIEGARLPGARRFANRQDPGPRAVNHDLLNRIRDLLP